MLGGLIAIVGMNGQRWALKSKTHAMARWYAALGVYIAGQVVQVAAYAYGTQELVAAMSNLSLVWNSLICTLIFNEPFTMRPVRRGWRVFEGWDLGSLGVMVIGTALVAVSAPLPPEGSGGRDIHTLKLLFGATPFLVFMALTTGSMALTVVWVLRHSDGIDFCKWTLPKPEDAAKLHPTLLAVVVAGTAAVSVTFSKAVVLLVRESLSRANQFTDPVAWVFVAFLVVALVTNLAALSFVLVLFDALLIIPVYYVTSTCWTVVAGQVLYSSWRGFDALGAVLFGAGLLLSTYGVWCVSFHGDPGLEEVDGLEGGTTAAEEEEMERRGADGGPPPAPSAVAPKVRPTRRGSQWGGALNVRVRSTRASSIDMLVHAWDLRAIRRRAQRKAAGRRATMSMDTEQQDTASYLVGYGGSRRPKAHSVDVDSLMRSEKHPLLHQHKNQRRQRPKDEQQTQKPKQKQKQKQTKEVGTI